MLWWLAVAATVALILAAAKAHGRQVRLEREQQGHFRVDFRTRNPPAVEAIWRTDRRIFWPVFAVVALLAAYWAFNAIVARREGAGMSSRERSASRPQLSRPATTKAAAKDQASTKPATRRSSATMALNAQ